MALRVVVVFEFDDVLYPNGSAADNAVDIVTDECERMRLAVIADKVWVDDVYMSKGEVAE